MIVTLNGTWIGKADSISPPTRTHITFIDDHGAKITIRLTTLARVFDIARLELRRQGLDINYHVLDLLDEEKTEEIQNEDSPF